ncbi:MAG: hypothetical protein ACLQVN_16105 [Bryobacteraceae bacterium]
MFTMLAVLVYGAAVAIPFWLLYRHGSRRWYWHVLALALAAAVGLAPFPGLQGPNFDLVIGFVFLSLAVWGIGGLVTLLLPHRGHHKPA